MTTDDDSEREERRDAARESDVWEDPQAGQGTGSVDTYGNGGRDETFGRTPSPSSQSRGQGRNAAGSPGGARTGDTPPNARNDSRGHTPQSSERRYGTRPTSGTSENATSDDAVTGDATPGERRFDVGDVSPAEGRTNAGEGPSAAGEAGVPRTGERPETRGGEPSEPPRRESSGHPVPESGQQGGRASDGERGSPGRGGSDTSTGQSDPSTGQSDPSTGPATDKVSGRSAESVGEQPKRTQPMRQPSDPSDESDEGDGQQPESGELPRYGGPVDPRDRARRRASGDRRTREYERRFDRQQERQNDIQRDKSGRGYRR